MEKKNPLLPLWIGLAVVGLTLLGFFIAQNWARTTDISYDLMFFALQTTQPIPVPALIGGSLLVGFLGAVIVMAPARMRLGRQVADLERKLARASVDGSDDWA